MFNIWIIAEFSAAAWNRSAVETLDANGPAGVAPPNIRSYQDGVRRSCASLISVTPYSHDSLERPQGQGSSPAALRPR